MKILFKLLLCVVLGVTIISVVSCSHKFKNIYSDINHLNRDAEIYFRTTPLHVGYGNVADNGITILTLYPHEKQFTYRQPACVNHYGYYKEFGDTIITYPQVLIEFEGCIEQNDTLPYFDEDVPCTMKIGVYPITDSTSFNYADCPRIYVRQKDGSIDVFRRLLPVEVFFDSIEYEGVKYSLCINKMSNWDYHKYPKPVRDSISKLLDTIRIKYLPVKYSRRKHPKKQIDISLQRISIDNDDDE